MGYYIEVDEPKQKAVQLAEKYGAEMVISPPVLTKEDYIDITTEHPSLAVVCVVDNGPFEAAGYVYDEKEFEAFSRPEDLRPKTWMLMDRDTVERVTGYAKDMEDMFE